VHFVGWQLIVNKQNTSNERRNSICAADAVDSLQHTQTDAVDTVHPTALANYFYSWVILPKYTGKHPRVADVAWDPKPIFDHH
jgi:hypothetical protein